MLIVHMQISSGYNGMEGKTCENVHVLVLFYRKKISEHDKTVLILFEMFAYDWRFETQPVFYRYSGLDCFGPCGFP